MFIMQTYSQLVARIAPKAHDQLRPEARATERSVSGLVRQILRVYLEDQEGKGDGQEEA